MLYYVINSHMNTNEIKPYDPNSPENVVKRLSDNKDLVDVMLAVEDYLDTNDMYVYKNWIDGELVNGPFVRKYWITLTLKWDYEKMPDPSGGLRLLKHGTKLRFRRDLEEVPVEIKSPDDYQPGTKKPKMKKKKIWLVDLMIPRRFVESISPEVMDLYDEEVDMDTADDAVSQSNTPTNAVQQ